VKKLKTGSFKNCGKMENSISIALWAPRWYKGGSYPQLAPLRHMLKMEDEEECRRLYYSKILAKLDPQKVYEDLRGKILLCWEDLSKGEWCHRRMVAEWIESELGLKVPEFTKEGQKTMSLF